MIKDLIETKSIPTNWDSMICKFQATLLDNAFKKSVSRSAIYLELQHTVIR